MCGLCFAWHLHVLHFSFFIRRDYTCGLCKALWFLSEERAVWIPTWLFISPRQTWTAPVEGLHLKVQYLGTHLVLENNNIFLILQKIWAWFPGWIAASAHHMFREFTSHSLRCECGLGHCYHQHQFVMSISDVKLFCWVTNRSRHYVLLQLLNL